MRLNEFTGSVATVWTEIQGENKTAVKKTWESLMSDISFLNSKTREEMQMCNILDRDLRTSA